MKSETGAIKKLINPKSKVSCHYFIKKSGKTINMVPDLYTSWHAGISFWKKDKLLNSRSIGIEIANPGHEYNYLNFSKNQIISLISLIKKLKKKYKIKKQNVLGHSDVSPLRKKDPGEKFPWKVLAKNKLCHWHKLSKSYCEKLRNTKCHHQESFFKLLFNFGYFKTDIPIEKYKIVKSFQRHFRPSLVNGKIDKECYEILKSLI